MSEAAEKAIHSLTDIDIPTGAELTGLSNLTAADLLLFRSTWDNLETERRRQIIIRLVEFAEDNLEFNFDPVFKYCLTDGDEEVRCLAIEGLWEDEETSLIEPLVNILEDDVSEKVQSAAAIALGKYALLAEYDKLRPEQSSRVRNALLDAIIDTDKSVEVRRRLLEAAAPLNLPEVKTALLEAYESDELGMKTSAIYAMGKNCDPSWLSILLQEMDNDDPEIRYEAAGACGELEEEDCVTGLIKLVNDDDDADVRLAAIRALGKIGSPVSKECLLLCLESNSEAIRDAAENALQMMDAADDPLSFRM